MGAYKDNDRGTWYAHFSCKTELGHPKQIMKRGFKTKREALAFEAEFKLKTTDDPEMTFASYAELYKSEVYPRIKESTAVTKDNIIDRHIVPFFADIKLSEISAKHVILWQNQYLNKKDPVSGKALYSKSFLKTIHNQLSAMLNHAVRFHNLKANPASIAGNMGSYKECRVNYWTKEEYMQFRQAMKEDIQYFYIFEVLYWCGIREGEMFALTLDDIDLEKGVLHVNKTYHVLHCKELVTSPKTECSVRDVTIPSFLVQELRDYIQMLYKPQNNDRLFDVTKSSLYRHFQNGIARAGIKPIRVHDLRHSHVSLLINSGNFSAVAIGKRVGHAAIDITFRYAHLFDDVPSQIAVALDEMMSDDERMSNDETNN